MRVLSRAVLPGQHIAGRHVPDVGCVDHLRIHAAGLHNAVEDVIVDNSLHNTWINRKKNGYAFQIRLSYYRGHFLSDIETLELEVDGEHVPEEKILFCMNEKEFSIPQVKEAYTEFWRLLDPATIPVDRPGGLDEGEHTIRLKLMMRVPYLPLPGGQTDHDYMPLDAGGEKRLPVRPEQHPEGA